MVKCRAKKSPLTGSPRESVKNKTVRTLVTQPTINESVYGIIVQELAIRGHRVSISAKLSAGVFLSPKHCSRGGNSKSKSIRKITGECSFARCRRAQQNKPLFHLLTIIATIPARISRAEPTAIQIIVEFAEASARASGERSNRPRNFPFRRNPS